MAGANESPRQKMINMMYLVLTALLALNVSRTIIDKFLFMNKTMEITVAEKAGDHQGIVSSISKAVADAGNRDADVKVLNLAEEVRAKTNALISQLDDVKRQMIGDNIDPETGNIIGAEQENDVHRLMVDEGKGTEVGNALNSYATEVTAMLAGMDGAPAIPKLALNGGEHPQFKDNEEQNKKDFTILNFQDAPLATALATISQLETEVMSAEDKALAFLGAQVGVTDIKFDNVFPVLLPESKVVAAGAKFSAELFLAASSSAITPTMKMNGNSIRVEGGKGKIEFTATAGQYDKEGLARKTIDGAITIKAAGGKDTTFRQNFEYFVAKPVIQIRSDAVQALYLNCGNELDIQVPALGTAYNPSFSVTGGQHFAGADRGKVTVVPNSKTVSINVSSGGNAIGTEKFPVRLVPKPTLQLLANGQPANIKQGMSKSSLRTLKMAAIADSDFKTFLPKDARYRVVEWDIILARGQQPVKRQTVSSPDLNLRSIMPQARSGDRLVIEVKKVERMNFKGQTETVNIPGASRIFTLTIN